MGFAHSLAAFILFEFYHTMRTIFIRESGRLKVEEARDSLLAYHADQAHYGNIKGLDHNYKKIHFRSSNSKNLYF